MIDKKITKKIAELAKIEADWPELPDQLAKIVEYIDKLKKVDVSSVAPMRNLKQNLRQESMRKDLEKSNSCREIIFKNAPAATEGFFRIPKVI